MGKGKLTNLGLLALLAAAFCTAVWVCRDGATLEERATLVWSPGRIPISAYSWAGNTGIVYITNARLPTVGSYDIRTHTTSSLVGASKSLADVVGQDRARAQFSPDGSWILVDLATTGQGSLALVSVSDQRVLKPPFTAEPGFVQWLTQRSALGQFTREGGSSHVQIWNPETATMVIDARVRERLTGPVALRSDGKSVITVAEENGDLVLCETALNSTEVRKTKLATGTAGPHLDPAFSPDAQRLAWVDVARRRLPLITPKPRFPFFELERPHVYTLRIANLTTHSVTDVGRTLAPGGLAAIKWTSDGAALGFLSSGRLYRWDAPR